MKTKFLALLMALAMLLSLLAACSSETTTTGDDKDPTKNPQLEQTVPTNGNPDTEPTNNQPTEPTPTEPIAPEVTYEITHIDPFYDGLARFSANVPDEEYEGYYDTRYGYMDMKGNVVVEPIYVEAEHFCEGRARVFGYFDKNDCEGHYGYIDKTGNLVIDMIYDDADATFDTLALVTKDGCQQYINRDGETVYTWTGEEITVGEFCNGMFWVETEEIRISGNVSTMTYYNENGNVAFSIEGAKNATINYGLETLSDYNEFGYAVVCIQGADRDENRVIDKSGKIQEWVQINEYRSFEEMIGPSYCILRWKSAGEACYINYEEQTVTVYDIDERYDVHALYNIWNLTHLGNGYYINHDALYAKERYQYLVKDNELILRLDSIEEFGGASVQKVLLTEHEKQDYFWVVLSNADGNIFVSLIAESGEVMISPTSKIATYFYKPGSWVSQEYYISYSFSAGLCKAEDAKTGKFGFIDISGEWVIQPQYEEVSDFYGEGDDAVAVVDGNTIIKRKGEVVYTIVTSE